MVKMGSLFTFFFLCFLAITSFGQETVQVLSLHDTTLQNLEAMSHSAHSKAMLLRNEDLLEVSNSVLKAESWLKTHVLARFPATKITTIVAGGDTPLLCQGGQGRNSDSVVSAMKNLYYSLTRWGLERDIKVSIALSFNCLDRHSSFLRDDLAQFVKTTNSTYTIVIPLKLASLSEEALSIIASETKRVKKFASFDFDKINIMFNNQQKRIIRKLINIESSEVVKPYPARPTPLPDASQAPLHSSIGFSVPAHIVKNPLPPLTHVAAPPALSIPVEAPAPYSFPISSPPTMSFTVAPEHAPYISGPVYGPPLPPCKPNHAMPPIPETGVVEKLWCVAKPSVPAETLQEALDYACGAGGANCQEIMPHGSCFYPDTAVAHASYAFNNYWQNTKRDGGICSFGGTAMLINSDPSFLHCRYILS